MNKHLIYLLIGFGLFSVMKLTGIIIISWWWIFAVYPAQIIVYAVAVAITYLWVFYGPKGRKARELKAKIKVEEERMEFLKKQQEAIKQFAEHTAQIKKDGTLPSNHRL